MAAFIIMITVALPPAAAGMPLATWMADWQSALGTGAVAAEPGRRDSVLEPPVVSTARSWHERLSPQAVLGRQRRLPAHLDGGTDILPGMCQRPLILLAASRQGSLAGRRGWADRHPPKVNL